MSAIADLPVEQVDIDDELGVPGWRDRVRMTPAAYARALMTFGEATPHDSPSAVFPHSERH